ncbi:DNA mismatch repair protein MutS [Paenibacillus hodogayensis]|uniref:DNA mismatch repair protein MutS n=1 Tax=Paenibacillus hodogayensis TaxID=279208 RepID=A0ABV5VV89_9BACL
MNDMTLQRLDYPDIKRKVTEYAVSYLGRRQAESLSPSLNVRAARDALDQTAEALGLLGSGASVPIPSLTGIETVLDLLGTGYVFHEDDFVHIRQFLHGCGQLRAYMAAKLRIAPRVAAYAQSMHDLEPVKQEIDRCIRNGRIDDGASRDLMKIRRKMAATSEKIKSRMDSLMNRHRSIMQEQLYSVRSDRYVLPIKKEFRKLITGSVLDESSSGQTVYVQPQEIAHLQHELAELRGDEAREEAKVLAGLTEWVEKVAYELQTNVDTIGTYDFLFAKAKYAMAIGGRNVALNDRGEIRLHRAVHPLLGSAMVPLDFAIGNAYRSLIITGPNTGGKTVALKTVGLLVLMVQSGLLVPVGEGSELSVFAGVAADIGDGQSIEQSLSTFSAHIRHMAEILRTADDSTLVLLDELAGGTDPGEGVGLSIALLEALHEQGATVVATTHFNEIKHFAASTKGFENARMEFDADTLQPLYRLRIGEAGESYALLIAKKFGIPDTLIVRSRQLGAAASAERTGSPASSSHAQALAAARGGDLASGSGAALVEGTAARLIENNKEAGSGGFERLAALQTDGVELDSADAEDGAASAGERDREDAQSGMTSAGDLETDRMVGDRTETIRGAFANEPRQESDNHGGAVDVRGVAAGVPRQGSDDSDGRGDAQGVAAGERRQESDNHGGAVDVRGVAAGERRQESDNHGGTVDARGVAAGERRQESDNHGGTVDARGTAAGKQDRVKNGRAESARGASTGDTEEESGRKRFEVGDSVRIAYLGTTGIVCELEDSRGMVGVLIHKQKCKINKKRLSLYIPKKELYPDDYDMDIVLETKQNRKLKKLMSRKHVEGAEIIRKPGE